MKHTHRGVPSNVLRHSLKTPLPLKKRTSHLPGQVSCAFVPQSLYHWRTAIRSYSCILLYLQPSRNLCLHPPTKKEARIHALRCAMSSTSVRLLLIKPSNK